MSWWIFEEQDTYSGEWHAVFCFTAKDEEEADEVAVSSMRRDHACRVRYAGRERPF